MADVEPLHALHYDLTKVGGLQPVAAPPYDVIDAAQRAELLGRSPYNVVEIDLPQNGGRSVRPRRRGPHALERRGDRRPRRARPPCGRSRRTTPGPDGQPRTRHGVFARVKVEDYGPGRIRPHERTHPGPKEDRLRLTRATRANLSPIFSLYDDPANAAWSARRAVHARRAVGRGHRRRGHGPQALARRRPAGDRGLQGRARRHRAADRRRPPPLRDRARLPAGGRGGRPRPDVPGGAAGRGPDRLPHAPARPSDADMEALDARASSATGPTEPRDTLSIGYYAGGDRADALPQGLGDRRRARSRASPSPTGASTRPCWRR